MDAYCKLKMEELAKMLGALFLGFIVVLVWFSVQVNSLSGDYNEVGALRDKIEALRKSNRATAEMEYVYMVKLRKRLEAVEKKAIEGFKKLPHRHPGGMYGKAVYEK